MAEILSVHHVCIETPDIEESLVYYQSKLGFSLIGRESCGFGEYAMLKYGNARIELIQSGETGEMVQREPGPIAHIGFEVDDVQGMFDLLRQRGIQFKTEEVEHAGEPLGGLTACSTVGPSGEIISFYHFLRDDI